MPLYDDKEQDDFDLVLTGTLTLLGLIIGFSFSMAINRYDLRKNYEEEEANAIGTEYVRVDLTGSEDAPRLQGLLQAYLQQRILFYTVHDAGWLAQISSYTSQLQQQMWSLVQDGAKAQPSPVEALVVSGMNDVLNAQGYAQAASWNRIPVAAWSLMLIIAVCSNLLLGFGMRGKCTVLLIVLPFVLSVAFFLIAELDSPRRGLIQVVPQNLNRLAIGLRAR